MTMTTKQALAERERLRAEAERAREAIPGHRQRTAELKEERKRHPKRREQALVEAARSGEPADLDALDGEQARIQRESEQAIERSRAAHRAGRQADDDLAELHRREFAAFAELAERLTAEARAHLDELRPAYEAAYAAWVEAKREWDPIARDNGLNLCPDWPLIAPAVLFGEPERFNARPSQVRVAAAT